MIIDLFFAGGPLFMGILSLIALLIGVLSIRFALALFSKTTQSAAQLLQQKRHIQQLSLLAIMTGVFAQLLGLYQAFEVIQEIKEVSPAMLAGGLKVSMIATLYGLFIAILTHAALFGLSFFSSEDLNTKL